MGTTLSLALAPREDCSTEECIRRLLDTLVDDYSHAKYHYYTGSINRRSEEFSLAQDQASRAVNEICGDDRSGWIYFQTRLHDGFTLGMNVVAVGDRHEYGLPLRNNAPLRLQFELYDLASERPFDRGNPQLAARVHELFARAVEALTAPGTGAMLNHASIYQESGWPASAFCIAVYHRSISDFFLDLGRTRACYQTGRVGLEAIRTPITTALRTSEELAATPALRALIAQSRTITYREMLIEFLEQLRSESISFLRTSPADGVVLRALSRLSSDSGIQFERTDSGGALLSTSPFELLWRAYALLYEDIRRYT